MKNFILDVDFVMGQRIEIEAENEEQAKSKVREMINKNPYDYTRNFSHCVGCKIIGIEEG